MVYFCFDAVWATCVTFLRWGLACCARALEGFCFPPKWGYRIVFRAVVHVGFVVRALFFCYFSWFWFDIVLVGDNNVSVSYFTQFSSCRARKLSGIPGWGYYILWWRLWYTSAEFGNTRWLFPWHYKFECTKRMRPDTIVTVCSMTCDFTCLGWQPTVLFSDLLFGVVLVSFCVRNQRLLGSDSFAFFSPSSSWQ